MPAAVAGGLALCAIFLRWRGSDLPAHFFRVGLVERDGFTVWNNYWFGGHHTPGYSLLFPVLGALVGIWTVAVASSVVAAAAVDRLLRGATERSTLLPSMWFAIGTVTNVAVGRLPFALGMAIGTVALLAGQRRHLVVAGALSAATAAASPVAGAFLAMIWTACALTSMGETWRRYAGLVACAMGPVIVMSLLYPQGGSFPFRFTAMLWTLAVCLVTYAVVPERFRVVRCTAVLYAIASVLVFAVPNPLGANVTRLGMYAAGPVLLALAPRRVVVAVLLPILLWWQWSPAFDSITRAGKDESTEAAYYSGLRQFLAVNNAQDDRIEIVPTRRHWEVVFVALDFPIARGWERQLDLRFQPQFYDDSLTPFAFRQWLLDNGIRYVALPDAPLDAGGVAEAAMIEQGLPYLRPVWRDEHWRVWEVIGSYGLVDGPADVVEVDSDSVLLHVRVEGDVVIRVRASAFWTADPPACVEPTEDGWIVVRSADPGPLRVSIDETDLVTVDDPCAPGDS